MIKYDTIKKKILPVQVEELHVARNKDKETSADATRDLRRTLEAQGTELQSLKSKAKVCLGDSFSFALFGSIFLFHLLRWD